MAESLRFVGPQSIITGWDFSTGGVKCLAFDLEGNTVARVTLPTDLWTKGGVSELNLMQLEGQARASVRAIAEALRDRGRLGDWVAGGISATHHTAGRIDKDGVQVRRAICWNDGTLARYHQRGLKRLGGQTQVRELIGGPWASRYTLSHLVKDEEKLSLHDWQGTWGILSHGALAAGFLTGNFEVTSLSTAASSGLCDLRTGQWCRGMLDALASPELRELAGSQLPQIADQHELVGPLAESLAIEADIPLPQRPLIFPTSDDQQAGLAGGGAVDAGQMAIILGNSAVVNSSSDRIPDDGECEAQTRQGGRNRKAALLEPLDVMRLNWGPYLWMRCYNNGAQFLNHIVGENPEWEVLEEQARGVSAGCGGVRILPFLYPEPSLGVERKRFRWLPKEPRDPGKRFRAALEALAYLIALGVRQHEQGGQEINRITVSGGIARSGLMCEILATVLDRPLCRLQSDEGPAPGAAATALAAVETYRRRHHGVDTSFTVADAVAILVKFRDSVSPNPAWGAAYHKGLRGLEQLLADRKKR